jgi:hypothetical protein
VAVGTTAAATTGITAAATETTVAAGSACSRRLRKRKGSHSAPFLSCPRLDGIM